MYYTIIWHIPFNLQLTVLWILQLIYLIHTWKFEFHHAFKTNIFWSNHIDNANCIYETVCEIHRSLLHPHNTSIKCQNVWDDHRSTCPATGVDIWPGHCHLDQAGNMIPGSHLSTVDNFIVPPTASSHHRLDSPILRLFINLYGKMNAQFILILSNFGSKNYKLFDSKQINICIMDWKKCPPCSLRFKWNNNAINV